MEIAAEPWLRWVRRSRVWKALGRAATVGMTSHTLWDPGVPHLGLAEPFLHLGRPQAGPSGRGCSLCVEKQLADSRHWEVGVLPAPSSLRQLQWVDMGGRQLALAPSMGSRPPPLLRRQGDPVVPSGLSCLECCVQREWRAGWLRHWGQNRGVNVSLGRVLRGCSQKGRSLRPEGRRRRCYHTSHFPEPQFHFP